MHVPQCLDAKLFWKFMRKKKILRVEVKHRPAFVAQCVRKMFALNSKLPTGVSAMLSIHVEYIGTTPCRLKMMIDLQADEITHGSLDRLQMNVKPTLRTRCPTEARLASQSFIKVASTTQPHTPVRIRTPSLTGTLAFAVLISLFLISLRIQSGGIGTHAS